MRIDAYRIFASDCSENRLVGALEANIQQVILLKIPLSTSLEKKLMDSLCDL
nr:MAG TPA: hypothetical protein [Caudoviricetes sp.]